MVAGRWGMLRDARPNDGRYPSPEQATPVGAIPIRDAVALEPTGAIRPRLALRPDGTRGAIALPLSFSKTHG